VNGAAAAEREETTQRKLILLSARDEKTVKNMAGNLAEYLKQATDTPFDALAYTLGQRRTRFPWTLAVSAQSVPELVEVLAAGEVKPVQASSVVPRLGFVFNGQGAQWFAMGRELMGTYPVFMETLEECDGYLREFGADWSLIGE
jgi:acyl transferase domain-containing protein